ncbi:hypothetical protein M9H77_18242 [Catharanthus roseus]|uniref:Uncharacterized protein n=1 Tax=Catharanthus roseus TaxID=4058 RepID=A0ACC0B6W5_CATRO|nr:hypothetical protein M9H77_18242 [Catharanthus roseus]
MLMKLTLSLLVNPYVCRILKIQTRMKMESFPTTLRFILRKLRIEDKGRIVEKELGAIHEELPISLSLSPSLMCYEVSFVQLKLFLEYYLSHVSITGDICAISFLVTVSFLLNLIGSMFDPSCYDFGVINNASIESIVVGFGLHGALFDILHDRCLGKFVENFGYVSSFLDTFMENHNDFVFLNQLMYFVSGQVEFSCNE